MEPINNYTVSTIRYIVPVFSPISEQKDYLIKIIFYLLMYEWRNRYSIIYQNKKITRQPWKNTLDWRNYLKIILYPTKNKQQHRSSLLYQNREHTWKSWKNGRNWSENIMYLSKHWWQNWYSILYLNKRSTWSKIILYLLMYRRQNRYFILYQNKKITPQSQKNVLDWQNQSKIILYPSKNRRQNQSFLHIPNDGWWNRSFLYLLKDG